MGHLRISLVLLPRFGSWACITHFPFQKMAIEDALVARLKAPGPHFGTLSPAQHCDCDKVCILKAQVSVQFIWIHIYIYTYIIMGNKAHEDPSTSINPVFDDLSSNTHFPIEAWQLDSKPRATPHWCAV
jgi:hypothetical protein